MPREARDVASVFCDALTAYRQDLERIGNVIQLSGDDGRVLALAVQLERRAAKCEKSAVGAVRPLGRRSIERWISRAERLQVASAYCLAYNLLESIRRFDLSTLPDLDDAVTLQQARICRTLGEERQARAHYMAVLRRAQRRQDPKAQGAALVGLGVLEGMRGRARESYLRFRRVRTLAGISGELRAAACHGEMALALSQGDWSRAILAGVGALEHRGLPRHAEAGVLVNLSSIAIAIRKSEIARALAASAIRRTRHPRVHLLGLAKLGQSAALAKRPEHLERFWRRFIAVSARGAHPAEDLEGRSEFALAFWESGESTRARRLAATVRVQAAKLKLQVIVARCDQLLLDPQSRPETIAVSQRATRALVTLCP